MSHHLGSEEDPLSAGCKALRFRSWQRDLLHWLVTGRSDADQAHHRNDDRGLNCAMSHLVKPNYN